MSYKAVILHGIEDVEHCLKNNIHNDRILFSTDTAVNVHLKKNYGLNCYCLSQFYSLEEISKNIQIVSCLVDEAVYSLDKSISENLNRKYGFNINFFRELYSVYGKHHFLAYYSFFQALKIIIDKFQLSHIVIYDYKFDNLLNVKSDILRFFTYCFGNIPFQVIKNEEVKSKNDEKIKRFVRKLKRISDFNRSSTNLIKEIKNYLIKKRYKKFITKKKTILIYEPLYNLEFLLNKLIQYNIFYYENLNVACPKGFKEEKLIINSEKLIRDGVESIKRDDPLFNFFLNDLIEDFSYNINSYINSILVLDRLNKVYPISLGIWGNSPDSKLKSLIFAYLRSNKIKTIGAQHGGGSDIFHALGFLDGDIYRCDFYISSGFTKQDLKNLYPEFNDSTEICSFGFASRSGDLPARSKKRINILYPISINYPVVFLGMSQLPPDKLLERQISILEYLNSLEGLEIYIKLFPITPTKKHSVFPLLKQMKNLNIVDDLYLTEFLDIYTPELVIIDLPSTPLHEVIHLDTEIFLMSDKINPFEKKALEELKKRVHLFEETDELLKEIKRFSDGQVIKKRDNSFCNHYLKRNNSENNILRLIDDITKEYYSSFN